MIKWNSIVYLWCDKDLVMHRHTLTFRKKISKSLYPKLYCIELSQKHHQWKLNQFNTLLEVGMLTLEYAIWMVSWQCHTLFSVRSNMYRQPGLGPPLNICKSNLSTGRSLLITSSSDTVSRRSVANDSGRSLLRINWTLSLLDLWLKGVAGLSFWSLSLLEDLGTEEGVLGRRNPSSISILDPLFPFLLWCLAGVYWCSWFSVSCNSLKIKNHMTIQCT